MNQTTMMNMSLTHPNFKNAIQRVVQADSRWQAGDCTWTTPASENLETPEITRTPQYTNNKDQQVNLRSSEYQQQDDDLFGT